MNNLPFREPMKPKGDFWYNWGYKTHYVQQESIWRHISNLIERNVGKSFNMTFHYFCKHFPRQYQKDFLNKFEDIKSWRWKEYYTDDQGLIQTFNPKHQYKGPYKVKSLDYRIQWKRIRPKFYRTCGKIVDRLEWYEDEKDFVKIIQGEIYEFQSRKDPVYVTYRRKKYRQYLLEERRDKKLKKEKSIATFNKAIESCSAEARRQRGIDQVKLLKHGFDENSFKGLNYHGRKKNRSKIPLQDSGNQTSGTSGGI